MSNQKILLVDSDAKSQRVLEVSLKKAGFEVATARTVDEAQLAALAAPPDVIVTEADFPTSTGFELCRRLRDDPRTAGIAVVFLALDGSPEAKIRAISAGADDYLTKPTFVKEILTRISGLIDRRQKEAMSKKERPGNFRGTLGAMGLVDVFQLVETGRKSGVLRLRSDPARSGGLVASPSEAAIWFNHGRAVDAEVGRLRGESAVYRLLLWDDADFELDFTPITRDSLIHTAAQGLLLEGMRRVDEWARLAPKVPPLHTRLEVDYRALADALPAMPREVEEVVRLFDGHRTLLDALDDATIDELSALGIVARLIEDAILGHHASGRASQPVAATTLEAWLSQTRGPTESADDIDAADILANLPSELTGAMYPSMESASQILATANIPLTEPPAPAGGTVRPEPLADELAPTSAILSRSTIPASGGSIPAGRSSLSMGEAPNEGRLVVRRLSSIVAPPPTEPSLASVPVAHRASAHPLPPPPPAVTGPQHPAATPAQPPAAPARPAAAPPAPARPTGTAAPAPGEVTRPVVAPAPELPMMVRPAAQAEPTEAEDTVGAASSRPRGRGTRGAAFRAARRPNRPSQPAPGGEVLEDEDDTQLDEELAATAPPAPRVATPLPRAKTPIPPPRVAPPRAPTPKPAPVTTGRDLDDDFAYLKQGGDDIPRSNAVQIILALAVVGIIVGFIAFLASDKKQERVPSSAVAPTHREAKWPSDDADNMRITTIAPTTSIAAGTASTATVVVAVVPKIDEAAVTAELDRGLDALKKQRWRDAQKAYAKAAELDPTNPEAQAGLGHALALLGRYAEATAAAKSSLELSHESLGHGYYVLGVVAADANRLADAKDQFRRFLDRDPSSPFAKDVRDFVKQ